MAHDEAITHMTETETDTTPVDDDDADLRSIVRDALHSNQAVAQTSEPEAVELGNEISAKLDQEDTNVPREEHLPEARQPPTSWSSEAKSAFAQLSPAVQEAVLKREREVSDGFKEYGERTRNYSEIENLIAPRRETWRQLGLQSDSEALNRLMTISDGFVTNPAGTLAFLAQQFRVDPHQIFPNLQQNAGPSQEQINQHIQQQATQLAREWIVQRDFQRFEQNPPPNYEKLKPLMGAALQNGLAHDLESAYRYVTEPARIAAEAQARAENKRRAASASMNGAPYDTPTSRPKRSNAPAGSHADVVESVRQAMAQHG
jgi:hypothetical protein